MKSFQQRAAAILLRRVPASENLPAYYENDSHLLEELISFAKVGLEKGETVFLVAPAAHISALEESLKVAGYNIFQLKLNDQYMPIDADAMLEKFVVNGIPDEGLFQYMVVNLAMRALKWNRDIRIFSELSATLWLKGLRGAATHLEAIWNKIQSTNTEFPGVKIVIEDVPIDVKSESKPLS